MYGLGPRGRASIILVAGKHFTFEPSVFFAPVSASFLRNKGHSEAHIISDHPQQKDFSWQVRVLDFKGKTQHVHKGQAAVAPLSANLVGRWSDEELLKGADPLQTQAIFEVFDKGGNLVSQSFVYFDATKNLSWQDPKLTYQLKEAESGFVLTLSSEKAAKGVWVDFGSVAADIEDNAFDMWAGQKLSLHIDSQASKQEILEAIKLNSYFIADGEQP